MKAWLELLGGLLIWTGHFLGLYLLASIADIAPARADGPLVAATIAFTVACALAAGALAVLAWRKAERGEPIERFRARLAALGGAVAAVAVTWQSAPAWNGFY